MKKRIAINGFGRIGRAALKIILEHDGLELIAINDLMGLDNAAYLLQYDTVYGKYEKHVRVHENQIHVGESKINYLSEQSPENLPWKALGIDIVIESTGLFTKKEDAGKHIIAGAKTVVISGPTGSADVPTVVHGVNTGSGKVAVFSCASCTTNNSAPLIEILGRRIGIKKAVLNTTHAFTASQALVDAPSKKEFRMGRAAANNLAPAATGAAKAVTKALPQYEGKFDGIAVRTPVPVGSISDITFLANRNTTADEVNSILKEESLSGRYSGILAVTEEPLVSSDIIMRPEASIVDLEMTRVVDGDLVKVMAWYDNEWGFTNQLIKQILEL
ncbi:type I glyceraldehyde-3-phosphate dehydrogenase [Flavobacterium cyanobacteriorum]|uniref:Type I glyceraldehyde-3-phosphate dehydrogenase n=1 Tax=Flavobacterium cyanobacteriorum TaxID=2022802 RepID=A0A255YZJ8_9FLAO|nr:glyceraldehyde 3-phosphate dehydrogenase NAD-binding domain-containing protein [Flavobacterium cyanobacteriorum]OYQ34085.1 type I glyceraldehyde-3-phosphate dehydrogenase [Flavobacterium cyanobacteriorum]